jgi:phosphate transport system substrate-binding protein
MFAAQEDAEGLGCYPYASNGVAMVVHFSNPLNDISIEQIRALLVGDNTSWAVLNGRMNTIRVISRKVGSTTLQSINDLILFGEDITSSAVEAASSTELLSIVAVDPHAVGFVSYADLANISEELRSRIRLLTVDQVSMCRETILSGRYPLTRILYFAVQNQRTPAANAFVDFLLSPRGRQIVVNHGMIPLR